MTKLRNIDAIKKMLDGSHRTQTKKTYSLDPGKEQIKREIGDRWVDENGKEWEQRDGYKITVTKVLDKLKDIRMPDVCPKCNKSMMKKNLDERMWTIHKMCFDCVIDMEHQLRIEGKFDDYEKQKVYENAMSWLRDAEKDVEDVVEAYRQVSFANSDGTLEKWSGGLSPEEFRVKIYDEFEKFKTEFIEKVKPTNEKVEDI